MRFYKMMGQMPMFISLTVATFCICTMLLLPQFSTQIAYIPFTFCVIAVMLTLGAAQASIQASIDDYFERYSISADNLFTVEELKSAGVGHLIDCLNLQDTSALDFEIHVRHKLIQILPEIQLEEAADLNAAQWQKLYKVLRGDDAYLIVATLKALKNAGNTDALLPVRAIAEGKSPAGQNEALRNLARECLPAIEERAAQAKNVSTLLRATNAPAIVGDTLLRPASAASETPPEQLLRPSAVG